MHRTEGANNLANLFTDGPPATTVEENILNAFQEEIASTIEEAGMTLKTASTDTKDQLKDAVKIVGNLYCVVKDVKAANTPGGGFTSGAWRTRDLTSISTNISGASLAADQITLPAGTYKISAMAPAQLVDDHKAVLYNVTDAADEVIGSSETAAAGTANTTMSFIDGIFTIASAKVFEIRHRCDTTRAADGFGNESNYAVDEVYTQVDITKIAD